MAKTNKEIHSRTVNKELKDYKDKIYPNKIEVNAAIAEQKIDDRKRLIAIADKIANSTIYFINYKIMSEKLNTWHNDFRFVGKYYPYAKGGPLYVDEPKDEREMIAAYQKQKVLRNLGFRFIVIENDTTYYDALEQLGEL